MNTSNLSFISNASKRHTRNSSAKSRMYIFVNNESVFENLINRRNRPYTEYKKHLKEFLMAAGETESSAEQKAKTAKWSQKAGCSCGCSPGFIFTESFGYEYFITIGKSSEELAKEIVEADPQLNIHNWNSKGSDHVGLVKYNIAHMNSEQISNWINSLNVSKEAKDWLQKISSGS